MTPRPHPCTPRSQRHRLYALITGTMLALAVATTGESRRLDVTEVSPTAAVSVATAERPAPAAEVATPAAYDTPNIYSLWSCASERDGVGGEEATVYHAHPHTMGVYPNGVSWLRSGCFTQAEDLACNYGAESRSDGVHFKTTGPNCVIIG